MTNEFYRQLVVHVILSNIGRSTSRHTTRQINNSTKNNNKLWAHRHTSTMLPGRNNTASIVLPSRGSCKPIIGRGNVDDHHDNRYGQDNEGYGEGELDQGPDCPTTMTMTTRNGAPATRECAAQ